MGSLFQHKNRNDYTARFDAAATQWDLKPERLEQAQAIFDAMRQALPLRSDMKALDFGAGTGLITLKLLPYVAEITAVDTSREMCETLKQKTKELRADKCRIWHGELEDLPRPKNGFDLIVSSMVLHHLPDVPAQLRHLHEKMRHGGWIALADLDAEDGSFHSDPNGVFHHGLSRTTLKGWLAQAGFEQCHDTEAYRARKIGADGKPREYPIFLITARANHAQTKVPGKPAPA